MISAWILYGVVISNFKVTLMEPAAFKTELKCLQVKERNEIKLRPQYEEINLSCVKSVIHD